jgi:hypothetical protein
MIYKYVISSKIRNLKKIREDWSTDIVSPWRNSFIADCAYNA